jgi:hypothetical protein
LTRKYNSTRLTSHEVCGAADVGYGVEIVEDGERGFGLKAAQRFRRGQKITQYDGTLMTKAECRNLYDVRHVISMGNIVINGLKDPIAAVGYGGGSFVNHCDTPNGRYRLDNSQNIFIVALRDISPGEFITCKYNKFSRSLFE